MQINITGKRIDVTTTMEEYANKKLDRLTRYFDRVQQIDLVIDQPSAKSSQQFDVEAIVHVEHHEPFVASAKGDDIYACIDGVVDKMTRQLTEHKEKIRNRKHS